MGERTPWTKPEIGTAIGIILTSCGLIYALMPVNEGGLRRASMPTEQLSNIKQISLGEIVYASNSDDIITPLGRHDSGGYRTWAQMIHPWVKDPHVYWPSDGSTEYKSGHDPEVMGSVGLNESGVNKTMGNQLVGRNTAEFDSPATLILVAPRVNQADITPGVILEHEPTRSRYLMNIEPPVATSPSVNSVSVGGWGTDFWISRGYVSSQQVSASQGLLRAVGSAKTQRTEWRIQVAFADTHAKSFTLAALAAGTDCTDVKPDELLLHPCKRTSTGTYLWGD